MTEKNKELIEVLLAISVVSKRLAKNLSKVETGTQRPCRTENHRILHNQKEEFNHVKTQRT